MSRLSHSIRCSLFILTATAGLVGCSGIGTFPDASVNPVQNDLGTIQGNDYGGHAPLVGAHVYVLQPSTTAYGGQATSLLSSTYTTGSAYPTAKNTTDPGIPTSWYYVTTDATSNFSITGDYTCTVGVPVYLYLYGGSPTFPSASNVFNVTNISSNGTTGEITFTVSTTENAYSGEYVTFAGLSSVNGFSALDGASRAIVSDSTLTTTTFSINVGAGNTTTYTSGNDSGGTATLNPTFNPAVVNLAVLGNCPSTGNFTYNPSNPSSTPNGIQYVYVNEVATTAAAYALAGFTLPATSATANNFAIDIGTDSGNIAGIQNAANIAGQLYNIQGKYVSTTYAGEGHIASPATTNGNGIVPQANIDTIANILASCVDSSNTATVLGLGGTQGTNMSTQCSTLFAQATNTGIPATSTGLLGNAAGQQPFDIAQAAINIAHHPAGPPYSYTGSTGTSAFVTALYSLPTGNVPFTPDLTTQPNDFTIGIDYTAANNPGPDGYPLTTGAESVAVDTIGNVWFTTQPNKGTGAGYLSQVNPVGVFQTANTQYNSTYIYGYVSIDAGQSPWAGSALSTNPITYVHATSTPAAVAGSAPPTYVYATGATRYGFGTTNYNYTYPAFGDSAGNMYFSTNITNGSSNDYILEIPTASTAPTTAGTNTAAMPDFSTSNNGLSHAAIDATGAVYLDYNAAGGAGTPQIGRNILSSGADASGTWPVKPTTTGCSSLTDPEQLATTHSGDVIVPDYDNGAGTLNTASSHVFYITAAGACTELSGATLEAGLYSPFGAAVDGADYVYITNRGGSTISVLNTSAGTAGGTTAISPPSGYEPQYLNGTTLTAELSDPLNIAIDPSGDAWITDYGNNSIVEIIGVAYPATTPLSVAANTTTSKIGTKP
jgi:hypothetical protein